MSLEEALKTSLKRRVNWQCMFTLSTSVWRHGKLEQQQENTLLVFIMEQLPPQGVISICMVEMVMDQGIMIPSTSWILIHWNGRSYLVGP